MKVDAALAAARPASSAARRNIDRGAATVRLFEIGRRYLADARAPDAWPASWPATSAAADWRSGKAQPFDAFDAKAEVLRLA